MDGEDSNAEGVIELQDIGISMNTGFKIIANVNSHQFLPKCSQQACNYKPIYFPDTK